MALFIKNGRIIDPAQKLDGKGDVLIARGKVVACGKVSKDQITEAQKTGKLDEFDAHNLIVTPGWVDMHAHLREPGNENAETIRTGARAAAAGGFTTVACLPDTTPPIDTESGAEYIRLQSERANGADIFPVCALTKNLEGKSLAELGQLVKSGAVAFSDARPIEQSDQLLKGLRYAAMFGKPVIDIPRDPSLDGGVMNAGAAATLAGLSGSPAVSEELAVVRGCLLARESSGGHYHAAWVSVAGAIEQIRRAKALGISASCAVAAFSFLLSEENVRETYDPRYKLHPPLRSKADIAALIAGVKDGTIDCIVSAHAPVADEGKRVEYDVAPFGGSLLEISAAAALEALHHRGEVALARIIEAASTRPAAILGLTGRKGTLAPGADGDVTILDIAGQTRVDSRAFLSKSHVCPLDGMVLRGRVAGSVARGRLFDRTGG